MADNWQSVAPATAARPRFPGTQRRASRDRPCVAARPRYPTSPATGKRTGGLLYGYGLGFDGHFLKKYSYFNIVSRIM